MVFVAVGCGLAGAIGAVFFRFLIRLVQAALFEGTDGLAALFAAGVLAEAQDPLKASLHLAWYWRVAIPGIGGLLVGPFIYWIAREAKGHGVPEVMAAVALRGGVIRRRVAAVKIVASAISIGSGGSVGREGPIIQIGAALGSAIGQALKMPASAMRTLVACGGAAGLAATFNAPIAGALFAAEIILANFGVAQIGPVVISSVVATVASRFFLGNHPAFPVPAYELVSPFELLPYVIVGLAAGLVAILFMRTLAATENLFENSRIPEYLQPAVGGLIVGCIAIWLPNVYGVGYSTISGALVSNLPAALLGVLVLAKIVATSVTLGSGGSGGIFAPSLFLGAMTGGFIGSFIHQWFPDATASSGAYALVTMGAVVAATTHAPVMAIIIIFELTQTIEIIPPLMAACVVSTLVATYLHRDSIYTDNLIRRGIDLFEEEGHTVLKSLFVHDVIDRQPELLSASASFQEVVDRVLNSEHTEFFVVSEQNQLEGTLHLREFTRMLIEQEALVHLVVAGDLAEPNPPTVTANDDLEMVMRLFNIEARDEVAVVAEDDPQRVVGSVHKKDVIHAYNQEVLRRDLAGSVSSTVLVASKGQQVGLGGGYVLQEIQPPPRFFGRSIRELGIGAKTGVQIVLLRKRATQDDRPRFGCPRQTT
ncbi:MAG: chloride channel protein [Myxococcales bacterium]|nr:chloride channel protein [Myxococcales bacterium]